MNGAIGRISRQLFRLHGDFRVMSSQRLLIKRHLPSMASDKKEDTQPKKENDTIQQDEEVKTEENEEVLKLKEDLAEMKDKYQRAIAENENVRKRLRKEVNDSKLYAIQGFCKDLLTVADILSTAVAIVHTEHEHTKLDDKNWDDFYDGVKMTGDELMAVFKRHGLERFTPEKGDKFDPTLHEAMFQAPVPELKPGLVAHVQNSGYTLHNRTLRPAQVGVSK